MKCLSIRQPWAWAILHAGKDIENRSWEPRYRGPVAIHASLYKPRQADVALFNEVFVSAVPSPEDRARICPRYTEALSFERGGIVGVVDLVRVCHWTGSPWFSGPVGLVIENPRPVRFIPMAGRLGLFELPEGIAAQISEVAA